MNLLPIFQPYSEKLEANRLAAINAEFAQTYWSCLGPEGNSSNEKVSPGSVSIPYGSRVRNRGIVIPKYSDSFSDAKTLHNLPASDSLENFHSEGSECSAKE
jgi:hypothetical protein